MTDLSTFEFNEKFSKKDGPNPLAIYHYFPGIVNTDSVFGIGLPMFLAYPGKKSY